MSTPRYSQTSRDRLAFNALIAIPVIAVLAVIRYFQRPEPAVEGSHPELPL